MRENTVQADPSGSPEIGAVAGARGERKRKGPAPRPLDVRLWEKVDKNGPTQPHMSTPCWVFTGSKHSDGYGQISAGGHCGKMIGAHRAAWMLEHGPIPAGMDVCHECDNPPCCRPDHLFLGTRSENMKDAYNKGRVDMTRTWGKNKGARNGNVRLSAEQVLEIRGRQAGATAAALAAEFGVSKVTIHVIWQRRTWRHLPEAA